MAQFSDTRKLQQGFFHALSKSATLDTQAPYESAFKSGHSVFNTDVFTESIGFAADEVTADIFVSANPTIIKKYTQFTLTAIPGSNNQAYMIKDGGAYIRPIISPVDVIDSLGNLSFGYDVKLYKGDGTFIPPTLGAWNVDAYSGLILFNPGQTPVDLGWGAIKITCYCYIGQNLKETLSGILSGTTWQAPVLSRAVTDPSALTPVEGDRQIVAVGAIGTWLGQDNNIATYESGVWTFKIPAKGWTTYILDINSISSFNGLTWESSGSSLHNALDGRLDPGCHPAVSIDVDTTGYGVLVSPTEQQEMNTEIDLILAKLIPAKPANLSTKIIDLSTFYTALEAGTGVSHNRCTDDTTPTSTNVLDFYDGDSGTLSCEIDTIETGVRVLSTASDVGTYGELVITADDDPYAGQSGKEGFWKQLAARIQVINPLAYAEHSMIMKHTNTGDTNLRIFWVDNPAISSVSGTTHVLPTPTTRYISGVPSLANAQQISISTNIDNAVGKHYNSTRVATAGSPQTNTINLVPASPPAEGGAVSFINQMLTVSNTVYSENVQVTITPYNSKNVAGTASSFLTSSRVDTVSNETPRRISGIGDFPAAGYGGVYDSTISLLSYTDELQLLNGLYGYPTGNYTLNLPTAGPNYTGLVNERWVCFQPQSVTNATGFTITFNGTQGTWVGTNNETSGVKVYFQIGASVWGDANRAYAGVGNLTTNGQAMMVVASSNYTVKRCTIGTVPMSGVLTIRIALPTGSNKRFSGITISAVS